MHFSRGRSNSPPKRARLVTIRSEHSSKSTVRFSRKPGIGVNTDRDITAHAETALVRMLEQERLLNQIGSGTLYTSCEPCPMCVGAMFWIGVRRVVFGLSSPRLTELATPLGLPTGGFTISAAEIGGAASPPIHFDGPHREDEAAIPHLGFWAP